MGRQGEVLLEKCHEMTLILKDCSACCVELRLEESKNRSRETDPEEAIACVRRKWRGWEVVG